MKTNVEQVNRYLTTYQGAGGHFPEKTNSAVRKLASQVYATRCSLECDDDADLAMMMMMMKLR